MPNIIKSRDQLNRLNVESFDTTTGGTTAATALNIQCGTTGANVLVNVNGFRA
jgi:hypothetical protein